MDGLKDASIVPLSKARGHAASLVTIGMEKLAATAPDVTFIHTFPRLVTSGSGREMQGVLGVVVRAFSKITGPFLNIPQAESGAYHLFFATSAKYPPKHSTESQGGVMPEDDVEVARGIDGKIGSGMYCVDERGESATPDVEQLLQGFRNEGVADEVWKHTEEEWQRIVGTGKA